MDGRARTWAFIVWPESAPERWLEMLEDTHIPAVVSPLHDRDVWTFEDELRNPSHKAGTLKKPHYHVVLYYGGKKGPSQVLADVEPLGVRHVERVRDTAAYNRYLCHMDNPDKAQYSPMDMVRLSGAVCELDRPISKSERHAILTDITRFIDENGVTEYAELMLWCIDNRPEWASVAMDHTIYLCHVLSSVRHSNDFTKGRGGLHA